MPFSPHRKRPKKRKCKHGLFIYRGEYATACKTRSEPRRERAQEYKATVMFPVRGSPVGFPLDGRDATKPGFRS
jgi:hypothetical protein